MIHFTQEFVLYKRLTQTEQDVHCSLSYFYTGLSSAQLCCVPNRDGGRNLLSECSHICSISPGWCNMFGGTELSSGVLDPTKWTARSPYGWERQ